MITMMGSMVLHRQKWPCINIVSYWVNTDYGITSEPYCDITTSYWYTIISNCVIIVPYCDITVFYFIILVHYFDTTISFCDIKLPNLCYHNVLLSHYSDQLCKPFTVLCHHNYQLQHQSTLLCHDNDSLNHFAMVVKRNMIKATYKNQHLIWQFAYIFTEWANVHYGGVFGIRQAKIFQVLFQQQSWGKDRDTPI